MGYDRPTEYWRVIASSERVKRERTYNGPGARKKALEFAFHARAGGAKNVKIEQCKPVWSVIEDWDCNQQEFDIE